MSGIKYYNSNKRAGEYGTCSTLPKDMLYSYNCKLLLIKLML